MDNVTLRITVKKKNIFESQKRYRLINIKLLQHYLYKNISITICFVRKQQKKPSKKKKAKSPQKLNEPLLREVGQKQNPNKHQNTYFIKRQFRGTADKRWKRYQVFTLHPTLPIGRLAPLCQLYPSVPLLYRAVVNI